MSEDSSKVEVLTEAIKSLNKHELFRLKTRLDNLMTDKVDALFDTICALEVKELVRLMQKLNALMSTKAEPPAAEPGSESGDRVKVGPGGPHLSGSAKEPLPVKIDDDGNHA